MAHFLKKTTLTTVFAICSSGPLTAQSFQPLWEEMQTQEKAAAKAISEYYNTRQVKKRQILEKRDEEFQKEKRKIETEFAQKHAALIKEEVSDLRLAQKQYLEQYHGFQKSTERFYSCFNLAVVYRKLLELDNKNEVRQQAKSDVLPCLGDLFQNGKEVDIWDEGSYLSVILKRELNLDENGIEQILVQVVASGKQPHIVFLAARDLADLYYQRKSFVLAEKFYIVAKEKLSFLPKEDYQGTAADLYYRLLWTEYRLVDQQKFLQVGFEFLEIYFPGQNLKDDLSEEVVDLIAMVLADEVLVPQIKHYFRVKPELVMGRLSFPLIRALIESNDSQKLNAILEDIKKVGINSQYYPQMQNLIAGFYKDQNNDEKYRQSLAELAFLLPEDNQWQKKQGSFAHNPTNYKNLAENAAIYLASYYYRLGLIQNNTYYLKESRNYFEILAEYSASIPRKKTWLLYASKAEYYAENYRQALRKLMELKKSYVLEDIEITDLLYYQVLTLSKIIAMEYLNYLDDQDLWAQKQDTLADDLAQMREYLDLLLLRGEKDARLHEATLLAAASHRDVHFYREARDLFRKVLSLNPPPEQLAAAVRGILYSALKLGKLTDLIMDGKEILRDQLSIARDFSLRQEVATVIRKALESEKDRLIDQGKYLELAKLFYDTTREFPSDFNEDEYLDNAASFYALEGDHVATLKVTGDYLKTDLQESRAHIVYLHARALEELQRPEEAMKYYYALITEYPTYERVKNVLAKLVGFYERAKNEVELAKLSRFRASISSTATEKRKYLEESFHYHFGLLMLSEANSDLFSLEALARSREDKINVQFNRILLADHQGDHGLVEKEFRDIRKQLTYASDKLSPQVAQALKIKLHLTSASIKEKDFYRLTGTDQAFGDLEKTINDKNQLFLKIEQDYLAVIRSKNTQFLPVAQYKYALLATSMADIYAQFIYLREVQKNTEQSELVAKKMHGFSELAKSLFYANALLKQRNEADLSDDQWIRLSEARLLSIRE